jgi:hypothetical protein
VRRPAVVWSILDLFPIFLIYKGAQLSCAFSKKKEISIWNFAGAKHLALITAPVPGVM